MSNTYMRGKQPNLKARYCKVICPVRL